MTSLAMAIALTDMQSSRWQMFPWLISLLYVNAIPNFGCLDMACPDSTQGLYVKLRQTPRLPTVTHYLIGPFGTHRPCVVTTSASTLASSTFTVMHWWDYVYLY